MEIYQADTDALLSSQHRDPLLRHLTHLVVDLAQHHSPPAAGPAIDVGCGVGRTTAALAQAGYEVVGIDPSERAIALARESAHGEAATFHVADATAEPPPGWQSRFRIAVCSEVIEHVPEPEAVVGYCRAVLQSGGVLLLTTPHDRAQWTVMDDYAGHVRRFSIAEVEELLASFELLALATEGFPTQRCVMKAYDAWVRRRGGGHAFDDYGDSAAYSLYTTVMPWLLRIDHRLRGLRRGTTVVAVARARHGTTDYSSRGDLS